MNSQLYLTSRIYPRLYLKFLFCFLLGVTGCDSIAENAMVLDYPAQPKSFVNIPKPNAYQEDFFYLKALCEEIVPLVDKYFPPDNRAAMEKEILSILGDQDCTKEIFDYCIRRYLAGFNNQHAFVFGLPTYLSENPFYPVSYPISFKYTGGELFVLNVAKMYDHAVIGQKVTSINGLPVTEVEKKIGESISAENICAKRAIIESYFYYSRPEIYKITGLTDPSGENLKLEFKEHRPVSIEPFRYQDSPIPWQRSVPKPHPITDPLKHNYDGRIFSGQNYAYFQFNSLHDKSEIFGELNVLKPWLRPLARFYIWYQSHFKNSLVNRLIDKDRPVFKDYLAPFIGEANRQSVTNLVIDMRYNGGGNYWLGTQLIYHLTRRDDLINFKKFCYNPEILAMTSPEESEAFRSWFKDKFGKEPPLKQLTPMPYNELPFFSMVTYSNSPFYVKPDRPVFNGRVFVLANQNTKSAAAWLTALLQDNQLAVVIGTTTDYHPTGPTGLTTFKLPKTGYRFSLPSDYFERAAPAKGEGFQPDYWVENTVDDFYAGRDAVFEKVLELIRNSDNS